MNNLQDLETKTSKQLSLRCFFGRLSDTISRYVKYIVRQPLFYCFLAPFLIMLGVYASIGVFPFGNNSVLVLDLNGQYVYFFEALRSFIYGDASLLYSFSRALGGEFMGIYAYYLASPLSYLVALFPKSMITEALLLMILTKCGLCGLSFGYLLKEKAKINDVRTVAFSLLYALSGYVVVMQHNTMWIDNVFLLPCVILGIDALIREKKYKLFVFSLAWSIMSNYYIGYMTCIFVLFYFFYSFFSETREERNPNGYKAHFLSSLCRIAFFSAIVILISAIITIPAYYSLTFGKSTFSDPDYSFFSKFNLFDLLTKFLFGAYDTVRPEGLPNVYCGVAVLVILPFYYLSGKISLREKICASFMCLFFIASFTFNTLDMAWHGFQAPNWLNYRYSYMLVFFLVYMSAKGFSDIKQMSKKPLFFICEAIVLFTILCGVLKYEHVNLYWTVFATLGFVILYFVVLNFIINKRHLPDRLTSSFLLLAICLEMFLGGLANTLLLDADVVISSRKGYRDYMSTWSGAFDYIEECDSAEFYRAEKTDYKMVNDSFTLGYRGLSGSSSTLNAHTVAFLRHMGYISASHSSRYTGSTPVADMILGVKYIASKNNVELSSLYEKIYTDENVTVYKNPYALSIAYGVNNDVKKVTFSEDERGNEEKTLISSDSPFIRLNSLISSFVGEQATIYNQLSNSMKKENSKESTSRTTISPIDKNSDSYVSFIVDGYENKEIYAYFPTFYYTDAKMYLNGTEIGSYFNGATTGYIYVGRYKNGEQAELKFKLTADGIYLYRHVKYFYYLDESLLENVYSQLRERQLEIEECREHYFSGTISVDDGYNLILTTIPYDRGWIVKANGEEIPTYEALDALLAFDLPAGDYTLELRYMPKEYVYALIITLFGATVLAVVVVAEHFEKKKTYKNKDEE